MTERAGSTPFARSGCGWLSTQEVEAALHGKLPAARREEFERHVDGCADCALLAADLDVFGAVVSRGALEAESGESDRLAELVRARLRREVSQRHPAPRARTRSRAWHWAFAAAASVVGLLIWQTAREPARPGRLSVSLPDGETYVAAVKPFSAPPVLRGERNLQDLWRAAGTAYDRGNYRKSEALLAEILKQDTGSIDARVYRGICLLALGRVEEARRALTEARLLVAARAAEEDLSTTSVAWFEGLAALEQGDAAAARAALDEAARGAGPEAERARELLERLP